MKRFYRRIAGSGQRFRALLPRARAVQRRRLLAILRRNAATAYGREHGFAAIADEAQFRDRVPVVTYAELEPRIDSMARGEPHVLVPGLAVAFEETGGTTRGPKLIPCTEAGLEAFRAALLPWLDDLATAYPGIAAGSAYWSISPAARAPRKTEGGIPIGLGSDAAYFGESLAGDLVETLAVAPEVGAIGDLDAWREATCTQLLARADLALVSVWSPTFFADLVAHIRRRHGDFDPRVAWPKLELVSCWDHAAARPYAQALQATLPAAKLQGKGLLATEGVVSVPLEGLPMPVLAADSGYYEFMDDAGHCYGAAELIRGRSYRVVMTTEGGLYRYAIGDRVRVHGYEGEAPLLEFLGRGELCVDLTGEKLSEDFVIGALAPLGLTFALLAPGCGSKPGYALFVDAREVDDDAGRALAGAADAALGANPQYAYARGLGQLAPLEVRRCTQPLGRWLEWNRQQGRRLGDVKPPALSPDPDWAARLHVTQ